MNTSYATASQLKVIDLNQIFRYRYSVFVERLHWTLPCAGAGLEVDQFDRDDTYHVCVRDAGATIGYARLLPTTEPYLLSEVFPQLMDKAMIPRSPAVWELSRFCSVDLRSAGESRRQADYWGCQAVLRTAVQCALEHGVSRLVAVSAVAMERILARLGVNASRASPTMRLHGHNVYAFWIDLDDITKNALGISSIAAKAA
ncbi:N-acyl-L-homoserine lactone synthetase [Duganella sp. CF517]|uniref:acyl-homoserine-lactone synthase n=1 Tax=Duganella sp. CF517 TaxID=1881038 RepID=UPI0008C7F1B9|nr:acyl-homoserine-lactone synthase [Duganella sp. CF517]SEO04616.1 N-acyl-L-homoserine lactone synthetase [Duganella sp. CF517]